MVSFAFFSCALAGVAAGEAPTLNVIVEGPLPTEHSALASEFAALRDEASSLASAAAKQQVHSQQFLGKLAASSGEPLRSGASFLADVRVGANVAELVAEVDAGGHTAKQALRELSALAADPAGRSSVVASGAVRAAETLLKRPSTSSAVRGVAGSFLTLLSGMPVASSVADERTGGSASVDVVVPRPSRVYGPDRANAELASGVSPEHVESASFLSSASGAPSDYDRETQAPMIWINLHKSVAQTPQTLRNSGASVGSAAFLSAGTPQVINAEFDAAEVGPLSATLPGWDGRAQGLEQRVSAVEQRLSGILGSKRAAGRASASLLALQPVDADRVREGLAVTEAMPAADGLNVNIVEREGLTDTAWRAEADAKEEVAELHTAFDGQMRDSAVA